MTSKDGTAIAYDRADHGPAVILIGGALVDRAENAPLARELADRFTAVNYDRRGRGASGDTLPYAFQRELEDLEALIDGVGGRAHVYGVSSGGALALEAAAAGLPIQRIAVYEVPYDVAPGGAQRHREYVDGLEELLAAGRRGDAVAHFMRLAGSSEEGIAGARNAPVWPELERIAYTLAYDAACLGTNEPPTARLERLAQPTLVMTGGARTRTPVGWEAASSPTRPTRSPQRSRTPSAGRSKARPTWSTPGRWRRSSSRSSGCDDPRVQGAPVHHSTVGSIVERSARRTPDRLALTFADRRWTYAELDRAIGARRRAPARRSGLDPGDRVAAFGNNSDAYLLLYLGCARAGLVHVPGQLQRDGRRAGLPADASPSRAAVFVDAALPRPSTRWPTGSARDAPRRAAARTACSAGRWTAGDRARGRRRGTTHDLVAAALHVGHDLAAQGRDAHPPRAGARVRVVRRGARPPPATTSRCTRCRSTTRRRCTCS